MTPRRNHRLNRVAVFRYDSRHEDGMLPSPFEQTARRAGSADMEVQGPGSIQRPVPTGPSRAAAPSAAPQTPAVTSPKDAVEISSAGQLLDKLSKSPEIRAERLAQIKAAIEAGHYDTEDKLEAALMNLFQSIANERND
jgi:flagellar biosynthesis anti-sigma factor FlgM